MLTLSFQGVQIAFYPSKALVYVFLGIVGAAALALVGLATVVVALVNFVLTAPDAVLMRLCALVLSILLGAIFVQMYPYLFRRMARTVV